MAGLMLLARRAKLLPVAVVTLLALQGCERAKTKLDREVDRLCAIDGGVHVYETVKLPKENFGPDGEVFPQYRGYPSNRGGLGPAYVTRNDGEVLVAGNPALERLRTSIVRLADKKVLGSLTVYRRSGGDMPGPWEPSRYSCPVGPNFNLENLVFKPQEE